MRGCCRAATGKPLPPRGRIFPPMCSIILRNAIGPSFRMSSWPSAALAHDVARLGPGSACRRRPTLRYHRNLSRRTDDMASISMYEAAVTTMVKVLENLAAVLEKADAHAQAKKIEPAALL